jgi:pyridoxal phosphate enzyme (YggS family)
MAHLGLEAVQERIARACHVSGRDPADVDLVVVSKQRSAQEIRAVYDAGQRRFAENRQQALVHRFDEHLPSDIEWHFIGPLQSRKARSVGARCSMLQSLDRMKLARIWANHAPDVPVLVEFNLASEPQKSGFDPSDADEVLDRLVDLGLDVRGTMAIPPAAHDPVESRPWFAMLRSIHDRWGTRRPGIDVCSMGMSADLEVAIEEGATMVRVGRAIFADRPPWEPGSRPGSDRQDG